MDLLKYCLAKKGAHEDYPFGSEPLVVKISTRMFALFSYRGDKLGISLKCDPFVIQSLKQQYASITPGYHLNKQHWITIQIDGSVPENELIWLIDLSYELVYKSLTKSEKESINNA
jgi:predicted DNA-binding protein (MmcQ/YjbR family)